MNRDGYGKEIPLGIHFECQRRGIVFLQRMDGVWIAGVSSFDQMQFLQEISDSAISVYSGANRKMLNIFIRNASVKTRKTGYLYGRRRNPDRNRLMNLIRPVINCIGQDFLNRTERIIENADV